MACIKETKQINNYNNSLWLARFNTSTRKIETRILICTKAISLDANRNFFASTENPLALTVFLEVVLRS